MNTAEPNSFEPDTGYAGRALSGKVSSSVVRLLDGRPDPTRAAVRLVDGRPDPTRAIVRDK